MPQHAEVFEAVVRKLRGRLMPPPGSPQPEQAEIDAFVAWLERSLDSGAAQQRTVGYVPAQRLNRTEYANAVKDLLAVEIDPTEYLPAEIEVDGFTNIAAALSVSPAFLEQYVNVARTVAHLAVGEPMPKVAAPTSRRRTADQDGYVDGMPLGTRGGMRFKHTFPADGEYRLTITDLDFGLYPRVVRDASTRSSCWSIATKRSAARSAARRISMFIDRGGAPARAEIMKRFANIPVQVKAGVHEVVVTFIERSRAATDDHISGFTPTRSFSFTVADARAGSSAAST